MGRRPRSGPPARRRPTRGPALERASLRLLSRAQEWVRRALSHSIQKCCGRITHMSRPGVDSGGYGGWRALSLAPAEEEYMRRHLAIAAVSVAVAALLTNWTAGADPADDVTHHEFQVNCDVNHRLPDDPIVLPNLPGASHEHSFTGNNTTNAATTLASLQAAGVGATSCLAPDDLSAYWFPTMFNGNTPVIPNFKQVIYYKSGIIRYQDVRPFPPGLRYVVGSPNSTLDE